MVSVGLKRTKFIWTDEIRAEIIRCITEGMTFSRLCEHPDMPTYAELCDERRRNPEFSKAVAEARADSASIDLDYPVDLLKDAIRDSDKLGAYFADIAARVMKDRVEKKAPKEYGQLVKLAGEMSLGGLTLQLVDYGNRSESENAGAIPEAISRVLPNSASTSGPEQE
jgi:hypothetical protein